MNKHMNNVRINHHNDQKRPYVDNEALRFPPPFMKLAPDQQRDVLTQLDALHTDIRQAVLDEWAMRCRSGGIRNPAGYLFGLLRKARLGEFRVSAALVETMSPTEPVSAVLDADSVPRSQRSSKEVAQAHIAAIRQRFGLGQVKR